MSARAIVLSLLIAFASPALAEPRNAFLGRLVGELHREGASFACFSRDYGAAALAAHPRQRVVAVRALIDAKFWRSQLSAERDAYLYAVTFAFRLKGAQGDFTGVAHCGGGARKDSLGAGAQCAGPLGANAHLALPDGDVLEVALPNGADLWTPGPLEQKHGTLKNALGPDDHVFRLARTDVKACEDLAFPNQKPLRPYEP